MMNTRLRIAFAPPRYVAPPLSGIDLSTSGVKAVRLHAGPHGLTLASYTAEARIPSGAFTDGEIVDHEVVVEALSTAAKMTGITAVNAALPESKSYLFEANVSGRDYREWRTATEQHIEEYVPLPPAETAFDIVGIGPGAQNDTRIAGIGFARRIVDDTIASFDEAHIELRSLEAEQFALARAILPVGDTSTTLIIDLGKTTTKLVVVEKRIPFFATTIGIGGHSLTLAVQKHFGVTEEEARKIKAEQGIVPSPGNEDYIAAMLSTVSAIREELVRRLDYWNERVSVSGQHAPVSQAILVGGNASVRGLPEYLEGALQMSVTPGDVFTNLASRDLWIPQIDYTESLGYATAIGLALRDHISYD